MDEQTKEQESTQEPQGKENDSQESAAKVDWKQESRKWESRAKENKEAKSQLEALEKELEALKETGSTELKNALDELEKTRKEAETLKQKTERQEWIAETKKATGVPYEVLSLLKFESKDELAELAETLKAYLKPAGVPIVKGDGKRAQTHTNSQKDFINALFN